MVKIVEGVPWSLRLARSMTRSGLRGGYRLMAAAERCGQFNVIARCRLGNVPFYFPLYRDDYRGDEQDIANYEGQLVNAFCRVLADWPDVTLFDCGADIGLFSTLVVSRCPTVSRVLAFEPSSKVQEVLAMNMGALKVPATAIQKAVSSFAGKGTLVCPPYDASDHARYLVPSGDGDIEVTTIDSFGVNQPYVAIKIDVEGGEGEVLKGAERTIRQARKCVISLEANPRVAQRLGCDPRENLRYLSSIRKFSYFIPETGQRVDVDHPVLQASQHTVLNILAYTEEQ